ncbi:hypothetical protein ADM90_03485 [Lysinibacillus macroides]|uniref:Uncharacterized protein n=1 Tax=Lysinibacillus macroides TaxID=33935 RepID=A0A0M9DJ11_9BACI|nr:hypothetical protein ADM90_03485 [Lysinibacillus macroides]
MFRLFIFLVSYGLMILSLGNLILYLNYRTLGYSWKVVFKFIFQTTEFYMAIGACIILCAVVLDIGFDRSADKL